MTDRHSAVPAGARGAAAPLLAAAAAFLAGLPGLAFPFLAEDWPTFAAAGQGSWLAGLFGYYRPAYMATFRIETRLWGASPALAHLVSLLLVAACAALVVVLVRRYSGDPWLASASGLLFALHPWHVENAAWVAARADQLWALFALLAALAYDRWRGRAAGRDGKGAPGCPSARAPPSRPTLARPWWRRAEFVPGGSP